MFFFRIFLLFQFFDFAFFYNNNNFTTILQQHQATKLNFLCILFCKLFRRKNQESKRVRERVCESERAHFTALPIKILIIIFYKIKI